MPHAFRLLCPALVALALGAAGTAVAQSASPFLPAASAGIGAAGASAEPLEFAAVVGEGKQTSVNLFDRTKKRGRWIAVGTTVDDVTVTAYDAVRDQIVVKVGDQQKILTLRKSSGATTGPAPFSLPGTAANMNFNAPTPPSNTAMAPPPATSDPASAPAIASPEAAPAKPATPAPPTTIARQEEEARMLVSDLLEIGMVQRKAYEDAAQKKAAGQASNSTPSTPPPAAANGGG